MKGGVDKVVQDGEVLFAVQDSWVKKPSFIAKLKNRLQKPVAE